jgi:phage-related protein
MSKTTITHKASHNIFSAVEKLKNGIKSMLLGIVNGIKYTIITIVNGIKSIAMGTVNGIKSIFIAIAKGIVAFFKWFSHTMWLVFVKPFLPTHKVSFSMYTVIPGLPVNKNETVHAFQKGTTKQALKFYEDVIRSTTEKKIVPAEVKLYKRRKIVAKKHFGPVEEIKKFKIVNQRVKV